MKKQGKYKIFIIITNYNDDNIINNRDFLDCGCTILVEVWIMNPLLIDCCQSLSQHVKNSLGSKPFPH